MLRGPHGQYFAHGPKTTLKLWAHVHEISRVRLKYLFAPPPRTYKHQEKQEEKQEIIYNRFDSVINDLKKSYDKFYIWF